MFPNGKHIGLSGSDLGQMVGEVTNLEDFHDNLCRGGRRYSILRCLSAARSVCFLSKDGIKDRDRRHHSISRCRSWMRFDAFPVQLCLNVDVVKVGHRIRMGAYAEGRQRKVRIARSQAIVRSKVQIRRAGTKTRVKSESGTK